MQDIYIFSDEEKEKIKFIRCLFRDMKMWKWSNKDFKIYSCGKSLYLQIPKGYIDNALDKYFLDHETKIIKRAYKTASSGILIIKVKQNQILYLGKLYTFEFNDKLQETYRIDDNNLIIYSNKDLNIKQNLLEFYNKQANIIFRERVQYYSDKLNVKIRKLKIGVLNLLYGSYSSSNIMSLNESLIMTPIRAIDSIINHEFAHYYYMDHSQEFYQKLEEIYPDYYKDRAWIKVYMPGNYPPEKEE